MDDLDDEQTGPSWAWDFAAPLDTRGLSMLVPAIERAETETNSKTTLFVASTDRPDRAMDVVKQDWRLANFRSNPVILDNHMSMRVVGRAVDARVHKTGEHAGKLMIEVEWDDESPDPSVRNVGHQHRKRIRNAGSVGFRAGKRTKRDKLPTDHPYYQEPIEVETWWGKEKIAGSLYEQNELLEFSSATIPMNAEAIQLSLGLGKADPKPADPGAVHDFRQWLAENKAEAMAILWPAMLDQARADTDFRRILRAVLDWQPEPAQQPVAFRGDGLDFLFTTIGG